MADYSDWNIVEDAPQDYSNWNIVQNGNEYKPSFVERQDRNSFLGPVKDVVEGNWDMWAGLPKFLVQDLPQGAGLVAAQGVRDPLRLAQNVAGLPGEVSSNFLHLPESTNKYLQSRGFTKKGDLTEKILNAIQVKSEAEPWNINDPWYTKILKSIHAPESSKHDFATDFGRKPAQFEKQHEADEFIKHFGSTVLSGAVTGLPGIALNEFGAERNPYGLLSAKPIAKTIGKTYRGGVNTLESFAENPRQFMQTTGNTLKKAANTINPAPYIRNIINEKKNITNTAAGVLDAEISQHDLSRAAQRELETFTQANKAEAKVDVSKGLKGAHQSIERVKNELYEGFKQRYSMDVENPLAVIDRPRGRITPDLNRMLNKTLGEQTTSETATINPLTGKPFEIVNETPANATVPNYMELWKQTLHDAYKARIKSRDLSLSPGKKARYANQSKNMYKFADKVENIINETVGPEGAQQLRGVKDYFIKYAIPFRSVPALRNAVKPNANVTTAQILPVFDKYLLGPLKEQLLKDPELQNAFLRHDLAGKNVENLSQYKKVMSPEMLESLPKNMKVKAQQILKHWTDEAHMQADLEIRLKKLNFSKKQRETILSKTKEIALTLGMGKAAGYGLKVLGILG